MSGDHEGCPQPEPKCVDCGGHQHVCERRDANDQPYCRLKRIAYEFCGDSRDCNPFGPSFIKDVTMLLRETEDEAVERLSVARTRRLEELEKALAWTLLVIDHELPPFPDATGDDGEAMSQFYFASNMREARALLPNCPDRNEGEK